MARFLVGSKAIFTLYMFLMILVFEYVHRTILQLNIYYSFVISVHYNVNL